MWKIIQHAKYFLLYRKKERVFHRWSKMSPWTKTVTISSLPTKYSTRHKSLKQTPFLLNFLENFLHSLFTALFSLKCPLFSQCWARRILEHWDDYIILKSMRKGKRTQNDTTFLARVLSIKFTWRRARRALICRAGPNSKETYHFIKSLLLGQGKLFVILRTSL